MTLTALMKIPGIAGEAKAPDHEDEIDLYDIDWALEQVQAATGRRRPRGRVEMAPLVVRKRVDKASPYLAQAVATGQAFAEIVVAVRMDSGDAHLDHLTLTLANCRISGVRIGGAEEGSVVDEEVEIDFETVRVKYVVQADDHSAGDEHEVEIEPNAIVQGGRWLRGRAPLSCGGPGG